jgi:hypothetical protein
MKTKEEVRDRLIGLLHLIDWKLESNFFNLSKGIRLCKFKGSKIQKLCKELVKKELIDDGEDLVYETYIEIDNGFDLKWHYPYIGFLEYIDLISSLLGITFYGYIDLTNILHISSQRDIVFHTIPFPLIEMRPLINFLVEKQPLQFKIDPQIKSYLRDSWKHIWKGVKEGKFNRLFNAVRLYYLASTSIRYSESILHLAIIWETLFAPHSHSEIVHQISMNLSRFLRTKKIKRKELYKILKNIYSDRSKIVHGGSIKNEDKLIDHADIAFDITAEALYKILSSSKLTNIFLNEKSRMDYIEDLSFL